MPGFRSEASRALPYIPSGAWNELRSVHRNANRLTLALAGPVTMLVPEDSFHMIHVDRKANRVADEAARFCHGDAITEA